MKTALVLAVLMFGCAKSSATPVESVVKSRRQPDVTCEEKGASNDVYVAAVLAFGFSLLAFLLGELALKLALEPAAQVRRVLADISTEVLSTQHQILNPRREEEQAKRDAEQSKRDAEQSAKLKQLAGQLVGSVWTVVAYDMVQRSGLWGLPTKKKAIEAAQQLNLIANGALSAMPGQPRTTYEALKSIGMLLDIPVEYEGRRSLCPPPSR